MNNLYDVCSEFYHELKDRIKLLPNKDHLLISLEEIRLSYNMGDPKQYKALKDFEENTIWKLENTDKVSKRENRKRLQRRS